MFGILIKRACVSVLLCVCWSAVGHADPLETLFNKKWSLGSMACDFKGGVYQEYSPKIAGGNHFYMNGKINNSDQKQWFRFRVLDDRTIRYERRIYAENNGLMVQMLGSPTALVSKTISIIKIESETMMSTKSKVYRLDIKSLKPHKAPKFDVSTSRSSNTLCPS